MRYLLLLAIRIYWVIPTELHSKCIFKETCSHYVYRIAKQQGFIAGINALKERNELCRPGYLVYRYEGHFYLKTASGKVFAESDMSDSILPPNNSQLLDFDDQDQIIRHIDSVCNKI